MSKPSNIRIVDIAREAGVSTGTVDRVIHNRGRVSQKKKEQVERVLKEMNYEPNMAARMLASGKQYSIAVVAPQFENGSYWGLVNKGISQAASELKKFNVTISFLFFNQYSVSSFNECAAEVLSGTADGVIIASLMAPEVKSLSQKLDERNVPYVYLDSLVDNQNYMSFFGSDGFTGGKIAARLLMAEIGDRADIFVATAQLPLLVESVQVDARMKGFVSYLQELDFKGRILKLDIIQGDRPGNVLRLRRLMGQCGGVMGGIMFNSRVYELAQIADCLSCGERQRLKIAGYDAINANVEALNGGSVSFLLSQRPEIQGFGAVNSLADWLLFDKKPQPQNFVPIDILMKENVDYYVNYKF